MAWQLIYTSAPRSLEAGRSGFGTVARHRPISPLLVSAIERVSQFSRVPGTDPERVIFCHRIVAVAGARFHVLSATRDAGADYTGRTNHIAHHLIVEPREIAQLGSAGPSPADVLLTARWATSWNEPPRFFDTADEVQLSAIHPQANSSAWEQITGSANQAWLLASGDASRGAYIIHPESTDLRSAFAESLRLNPERLWQITFTTSLQPSDEPADFRWIGIEEDSPLRVQTESSGRPVLNLAQPETLPLVEVVQPAAPAPVPQNSVPATLPARIDLPAAPSAKPAVVSSPPPPRQDRRTEARPANTEPPPPAQIKWPLVKIALALVALILVILLGTSIYSRYERRNSLHREIDEILGRSMFFSDESGKAIRAELKNADASQMPVAKELALSADRSLQAARNAEFANMLLLPDQALWARARSVNFNVPPAITLLDDQLRTIAETYQKLDRFRPQADAANAQEQLEQLEKWREEGLKLATVALKDSTSETEKLKTSFDSMGSKRRAEMLLVMLRGVGKLKPKETRDWFDTALDSKWFRSPQNDTKQNLKVARQILDDWKFVESQEAGKEIADLKKRLTENGNCPLWLQEEAKKLIGPASGTAAIAPAEAASLVGNSAPEKGGVVAPAAKSTELYFFSESKDLSIGLPSTGKLKFFLRENGKDAKELMPFNNTDGIGPYGAMFKAPDGKLQSGTAPPAPPYELSVLTEDSAELRQIYVGRPPENRQPLFKDKSLDLQRVGHTIKIAGTLPSIVGSVSFTLITPADFDGGKQSDPLRLSASLDCDLNAVLASLHTRITAKRADAKKLAQDASNESAPGGPVEVIRKRAQDYVATLKNEDAKKGFILDSKTGPELVGDFAKTLADKWRDKKNTFEGLRQAGHDLGEAFGNPEVAKTKNKELQLKARELEQRSSGTEKKAGLSALIDLCDRLAAQLGETGPVEARVAKLQQQAEEAELEAKRIEGLPLLNGKLPPGQYILSIQVKEMSVRLYTFTK